MGCHQDVFIFAAWSFSVPKHGSTGNISVPFSTLYPLVSLRQSYLVNMQPSPQSQTLGKPQNGLLKIFLYIAPSSLMPSCKFWLLQVKCTLIYASSAQQYHSVPPGTQLTVPLGSFSQAENWSELPCGFPFSLGSQHCAICCAIPKNSQLMYSVQFCGHLWQKGQSSTLTSSQPE